MRIGFSGTHEGLTNDQTLHVHMLLGDLKSAGATQATHGMCIGADEQFHFMAKALKYFVIGCPGVTKHNIVWRRSEKCSDCDLIMPEKYFLSRNHDIVRESDVVIVCPKEVVEQFQGSGTWATMRFAKSVQRPLIILWPDGTSVVKHVPGVTTVDEYRQQLEQPNEQEA